MKSITKTSIIIIEGKYGAIVTENSSCHGYYIIKFSSTPYTLQAYLSIYGLFISPGEIVREKIIYLQSVSILIIMLK